jgi:hypothetical protein
METTSGGVILKSAAFWRIVIHPNHGNPVFVKTVPYQIF